MAENKKTKTNYITLFIYRFFLFLLKIYIALAWHYKIKSKYKIQKGESVIVVSNHQSFFDPMFILLSFNKLISCIAADVLLSGKFKGFFFQKMLKVIPKRKATTDINAVSEMMKAVNNHQSLLFFPEGNRSYGEFQFYIGDNFAKFLKLFKSTIILFNVRGGYGADPRWGHKKRRGKLEGEIKEILRYEDYADLDNDELNEHILSSLRVYDSESKNQYQSNRRAEYLERVLYVCPKCHSISTLNSIKNYFYCHNCDLKVEYGTDLHFHSEDPAFNFQIMNDWYQYQKRFMKDYDLSTMREIFHDSLGVLKTANPMERIVTIAKGEVILTAKELKIGNYIIPIKDIISASPIGGVILQFATKEQSYIIKGHKRFNPVKYVQLLNKLDSGIKEDLYFSLDD